ncbi:bifunctional hydroxymethylpyrimidine kinase/phosphomethylpyrimidine kinase [Turneriella parva]|uniref:hydroxymethylpyrimidine kinase n=1 Tax=Turneriella parva (strain ATCC BAA-1111 / DSM 21527 / NCTC 11395 / H) TaxID=869212 RepID=I4B4L8_TURPD|nr:bifunctional hydroxymethylpyrimidine kinase/phosphomethylpyrimidine kinase [Turneriella parva]AFM12225.1 phosphomethylpyrimidine kinase [Turneriella parva DSM 21527]
MIPVALSIAGSDSSAGAGIQADLKAFAACGVYGTTAITAITAQNTLGVDAVEILSPEIVYAQIRSVSGDLHVSAVKTGMLANSEIIQTVARATKDFQLPNLVIDTVMVSKSGHRLLAPEAEAAMREVLLPFATLITPNLPEAEVLTGIKITNTIEMRAAAQKLFALGARNILMKGGHLDTPDAIDILYDGKTFMEISAPRVETNSTHGTGCTLSASIAAYLAQGEKISEACRKAKAYLTQALQNAQPLGHGHGPVNHFWYLRN